MENLKQERMSDQERADIKLISEKLADSGHQSEAKNYIPCGESDVEEEIEFRDQENNIEFGFRKKSEHDEDTDEFQSTGEDAYLVPHFIKIEDRFYKKS